MTSEGQARGKRLGVVLAVRAAYAGSSQQTVREPERQKVVCMLVTACLCACLRVIPRPVLFKVVPKMLDACKC